MKTLLILASLAALASCVTETTKNADGTTTTAKRFDGEAFKTGTTTAVFLVDHYSGK